MTKAKLKLHLNTYRVNRLISIKYKHTGILELINAKHKHRVGRGRGSWVAVIFLLICIWGTGPLTLETLALKHMAVKSS